MNWKSLSCNQDGISDTLLGCFLMNNMYQQYVMEPTRGRNILDLVLSNTVDSVLNIEVLGETFLNSDHHLIRFSVSFVRFNKADDAQSFRDFKNADFLGFGDFLRSVVWPDVFSSCSAVNDFYSVFCDVLEAGTLVYVPLRRRKGPDKLPNDVRRLRNRKNILWKNRKKDGGRERYQAASKEYLNALRNHTERKELKCIESGDVNRLFRFANSKLKNKSGVSALKRSDGTLAVDDNREV